jgi:hypothetical protein
MADGIITLAGMRALRLRQRKKKEAMPEGWQDDVRRYLAMKHQTVALHRAHGSYGKLWKSEAQLKEARTLARLLGVRL